MTKFLCTKCSGFYNLDCKLETDSPYGLPDRCPFGVIKFAISWEVVGEESQSEAGMTVEPLRSTQSGCIGQRGIGSSITDWRLVMSLPSVLNFRCPGFLPMSTAVLMYSRP